MYAQDKYIAPHVGYSIGLPGTTATESLDDSIFNTKTLGEGAGLNAGLSFGVLIEDGVGVDFNFSYQNNLGESVKNSYSYLDFGNGNPVTVTVIDLETYNTWSVQFTPSLRFEKEDAEVRPFAQVGPSVVYSKIMVQYKTTQGASSTIREEDFEGSITIGGNAKAGVEFEIGDNVMLVLALQFNLAFSNPKSSKITKYSVDGEDKLNQLKTVEKETNYVKQGTFFNYKSDPDRPSEEPRERTDYSSVGFIFGLRFILD